jgi:glycosyltransferase involved in cell wall biosynthesis
MERAVAEEVEHWRPDVLHVTLSRMAPYMTAPPPVRRHLDLVDSMALNMRARSRASSGPARAVFSVEARLAQRYEARMATAADSFSVVAARDRAEPGLERAAVVPNGVDFDAFSYVEPDVRPPTVLFFGNLGYFHNIRPATFLADEVLDRVRSAHEGTGLLLAGARPAASVRRLAEREGVELLPDPPEMAPVLHSAAVAAIPMFSGSGMKNKVLEAFCAGTPVVANAAGIEGIDEAVPGEHFLLAEGAAGTAEAIEGLLRDPADRVRLARAARELVTEHYSWERAAERMLEAYGFPATPRD